MSDFYSLRNTRCITSELTDSLKQLQIIHHRSTRTLRILKYSSRVSDQITNKNGSIRTIYWKMARKFKSSNKEVLAQICREAHSLLYRPSIWSSSTYNAPDVLSYTLIISKLLLELKPRPIKFMIDVLECELFASESPFYITQGRSDNSVYFLDPVSFIRRHRSGKIIPGEFVLHESFWSDVNLSTDFKKLSSSMSSK